ncbi:aspartyl/asparaginyl beta-hydroxylase domain-containing protein [Novosphingobium album (ex Hu et al. 2023)]|uniref:Aspartyl/asparaginyl beta-hydroxylase domain-containing protein n=1 Tax=Novosphingobium album (ex Hu et al. 2023) TaxID=2930093 RepID=A0ABT0AWM1_9SPHN|nr:aspartyl/asparaginyl beta-hydroxylase domain-containing protein [Novosphingobium album (ex Hu et al. 2023)]MCJ2177233.1 aspartyl/asparaginyl beta-hydroxylase domain-containing protein [Novosphingobium album (ex Hu et al. 2023)]
MTSAPAFADVDRLVAAGQLPAAAQQLEDLLADHPATGGEAAAHWLKLAGLRRALRQPRRALDAVHRALELVPLDFMALVMRAGLLERLGDPGAGEAWAEAILQKPDTPLAPPLAAALAAGEAFHAAWQAEREQRLTQAGRDAASAADEDQNWRIARFRDNVLRKTRVYHSQPTHFHYPGLVEREFHPRHTTPWLAELEAGFEDIREEMLALLKSGRAELEPYIQYEEREALDQWRPLNRNTDWSAIHLLKQGVEVPENAVQAPRTMEILSRIPQPRVPGASPNAMFSLLAPRTAIPPHVGVDNTRLVCHLPLVVPEGCWFRVGAETRMWREGEAFAFDDTMEHEALNPSDALRVVLIFDAWHPGLSEVERQAVAAMIASEGAPAGQG